MPIRPVFGKATLTALALTLAVGIPASAEIRLAVAPAVLEVAGPLGGAGAVEIRVENRGTDDATLDSGVEELNTAEGLPSATAWSEVRPSRLTLEPGESAMIRLDLDIPDETDPGGHYAAVSIATVGDEDDESTVPGVTGRIVVPVLITVTGDEKRPTPPAIPAVDRAAVFLETDGRYVTRAEVRNDGHTHVALSGEVGIDRVDADGKLRPVASSGVSIGRVLPQREREYRADDPAALAEDQMFKATIELGKPTRRRSADTVSVSDSFRFVTTPTVELQDLTVCSTATGDMQASVALANSGSVGVTPEVSFQASSPDGVVHSIAHPIPRVLAWPDETTVLSSMMRTPSADGEYELVTDVVVGSEVLTATSLIQTGEGGTVEACPAPAADPSG